MRYESERTVPHPRADVFRAFTDLEKAPERISAIQELEVLTDGPMQLGTRFRETRKMFGKEATETMTVSEFTPQEGYATQAESCGSRYRAAYAFEELPDGTRVKFSFDATPVTFVSRMMTPVMGLLFGRMMKKCFEQDLDDLTAALERGA